MHTEELKITHKSIIKDGKWLLEFSLDEVREENYMLKGKIDKINNNHEELSKVLATDYSFFYYVNVVTCTRISVQGKLI